MPRFQRRLQLAIHIVPKLLLYIFRILSDWVLIGGENKYTIVNIDEIVKNFVDKVNTTDKII